MKKWNIIKEGRTIRTIILGGVLIALILACWGRVVFENIRKDKKIAELEKSYPEIYDVLDSVTYENFSQRIKEGTDVYVYIGRPSCGDCQGFEPELINTIKEKNLQDQLIYLNVHSIRENEEAWEAFKENYHIPYTPTIAMFQGGNLTNKVEWTPENGINMVDVEKWLDEYVK